MYSKLQTLIGSVKDYVNTSLGSGDTKRKRLQYLAIGSVSALTISVLINYIRTQSRKRKNTELDPYFSTTYHSARTKFRDAASKISIAKSYAVVIDTEADLSIDLCYIPGDETSKHLMLHFSGTHGVEGFAGSAIQIYLLQNEINKILNDNNKNNLRPHILFVHTLNPFGMASNRRWNKANIDLNRNCILNRQKWEEVRNRDPNKSGYVDLNLELNPPRKPTWFRDDLLFWWEAIKNIIVYGLNKIKKATVEGQYFKKDGVFFGGKELAIEHDMLVQFLTQESMDNDKFGINLLEIAEKLTLIDVHTGLGKYSLDYLLVDSNAKELEKLFPNYTKDDRVLDFEKESFYKTMYEDSVGAVTMNEGYLSLFTNSTDTLSFAQEYGTYAGIHVFKALRAENMAYHYSQGQSMRDEKQFYFRGLDVKHVFYPEHDPFWKNQVLSSGVNVFKKSLWR